MKKEKAITLIALIITIIILLILAGVSIAALSGRGIFANANKAKLETKRAQIEEWLKLKVMEEQINNPTGTSQEIIPKVKDNVDNNKSELLKMGKNVAVDANVTTEEDGNVCFYVTVDGDKYKVGLNEQKFIGTDDDKTEDVPTAEGIITFSDEKWSNGKASVKINLKDDYKDKYQMQYQINSIEGNWTEIESGTTVSKLSNGDKVYVRLWNGTKGGEYAVNNILDNIAPSATINLSSSSTTVNTAITVLIRSTDAQSGVNISKCKWVYNQTAEKIGTNEENYTEGVIPTAQNIQRISLNIKTAGTYYLHLLIVDNAGNAAEIISGEITVKEPLVSKVSIGDYVAYDPTSGVTDTSKLSYTSPKGTGMSHGNGNSAQVFMVDTSLRWRVLNKDTSTGEVVLISEKPIDNLSLKGAIGYLYAEEEINKICSIYGYGNGANKDKVFNYQTGYTEEGLNEGTITGSGARSVNVNDINKITGYIPSEKENITETIYHPTVKTETGYSMLEESVTYKDTSYAYNGSSYLKDTSSNLYKMLFEIKDNDIIEYWVASRCVGNDIGRTNFRVFHVFSNKLNQKVTCYNICYNISGDNNSFKANTIDNKLRPIVYLKASVKTTGQDSNGAWTIVDE